jgi:hypothetical protein
MTGLVVKGRKLRRASKACWVQGDWYPVTLLLAEIHAAVKEIQADKPVIFTGHFKIFGRFAAV